MIYQFTRDTCLHQLSTIRRSNSVSPSVSCRPIGIALADTQGLSATKYIIRVGGKPRAKEVPLESRSRGLRSHSSLRFPSFPCRRFRHTQCMATGARCNNIISPSRASSRGWRWLPLSRPTSAVCLLRPADTVIHMESDKFLHCRSVSQSR